jgi:hypothetical protein
VDVFIAVGELALFVRRWRSGARAIGDLSGHGPQLTI